MLKPILFNTEMVRALLAGNKTATRRVVKPGHLQVLTSQYHKEHPEIPDAQLLEKLCQPPYAPADILYVREAWGDYRENYEDGAGPYVLFRADYPDGAKSVPFPENEKTDYADSWDLPKWHPSIHMPREYARIFLRVTAVRVERLREISEEGAVREGLYKGWRLKGRGSLALSARQAFMWLWETLTRKAPAANSWSCNPWVWVIEFERCERPKEETV